MLLLSGQRLISSALAGKDRREPGSFIGSERTLAELKKGGTTRKRVGLVVEKGPAARREWFELSYKLECSLTQSISHRRGSQDLLARPRAEVDRYRQLWPTSTHRRQEHLDGLHSDRRWLVEEGFAGAGGCARQDEEGRGGGHALDHAGLLPWRVDEGVQELK